MAIKHLSDVELPRTPQQSTQAATKSYVDGTGGSGGGSGASGGGTNATQTSTLLNEAIWWVDASQTYNNSLLDLSGGGLNAAYGTTTGAPLELHHTGINYIYIPPGLIANNNVSIPMTDGTVWTATQLDGTTISGTHTTGVFTFASPGQWIKITTASGGYILNPAKSNINAAYTTITNEGTVGGNWTVNRATTGAGAKTVIVDRPLLLFSGTQYVQALTAPIASDAATVIVAHRRFGGLGTLETLIQLGGYSGPNGLRVRYSHTANTLAALAYGNSTVNDQPVLTSTPNGIGCVVARVNRFAAVDISFNGVTVIDNVVNRAVGPLWTPNTPIAIGRGVGGTGVGVDYLQGEFIAAAVWPRALTDAEIAQVSQDIQGIPHIDQPNPHTQYAKIAGETFTGTVVTKAADTTSTGLRLPHGAAPTAPTNGDLWTTTGGLYTQISGSTIGPLGTGGVGGGGALQTRTTTATTTSSLAPDALASGTITLAAGYRLLGITTNRPARVRLYATSAQRTADASRTIGSYPAGDHGLLFEYITIAGVLTAALSPAVDGYDGKATPDGVVSYNITNMGYIDGHGDMYVVVDKDRIMDNTNGIIEIPYHGGKN